MANKRNSIFCYLRDHPIVCDVCGRDIEFGDRIKTNYLFIDVDKLHDSIVAHIECADINKITLRELKQIRDILDAAVFSDFQIVNMEKTQFTNHEDIYVDVETILGPSFFIEPDNITKKFDSVMLASDETKHNGLYVTCRNSDENVVYTFKIWGNKSKEDDKMIQLERDFKDALKEKAEEVADKYVEGSVGRHVVENLHVKQLRRPETKLAWDITFGVEVPIAYYKIEEVYDTGEHVIRDADPSYYVHTIYGYIERLPFQMIDELKTDERLFGDIVNTAMHKIIKKLVKEISRGYVTENIVEYDVKKDRYNKVGKRYKYIEDVNVGKENGNKEKINSED